MPLTCKLFSATRSQTLSHKYVVKARMEWRCWQQQYLTSSWSIRWKMHSSLSSINPLLVLWLWADFWGHQPHICFMLVLPKFCFQYNLPPPLLSLPLLPLKLFSTRKLRTKPAISPHLPMSCFWCKLTGPNFCIN